MFIHFSDTHLGYSEFNKVDSQTGLNQREVDVNQVFEQVIDYILKTKPEFVIHSGDLFDIARPANRTISFALSQFKKLSQAGIPLILISGNHSTPRMAISGSIFASFKILPNIYPVYQRKYEKIKINNFIIHCLPHCSTEEMMRKNLESIKIDKKYKNILVTHSGISADQSYQTGEFNEQKIPINLLKNNGFDYIALGHYHHFQKIGNNAYFSGATERFGFKFNQAKTGFLAVNSATFQVKFIKTNSRPMANLKLNSRGLNPNQIETALKKLAKTIKPQSIVLLNINHLKKDIWLGLDRKEIETIFKQALVLEIRPTFYQKETGTSAKTYLEDISIEFDNFVNKLNKVKKEKVLIKKLGADYLNQAQTNNQ